MLKQFLMLIPKFLCVGVKHSWSRLLNGECGIVSVKDRSAQFAALPSRVAGCVPRGKAIDGRWDAKELPDIIVRPPHNALQEYSAFPGYSAKFSNLRISGKWQTLRNMRSLQRMRL